MGSPASERLGHSHLLGQEISTLQRKPLEDAVSHIKTSLPRGVLTQALSPALRRQRLTGLCGFEASLVCIVSFSPSKCSIRPCLKTERKTEKEGGREGEERKGREGKGKKRKVRKRKHKTKIKYPMGLERCLSCLQHSLQNIPLVIKPALGVEYYYPILQRTS